MKKIFIFIMLMVAISISAQKITEPIWSYAYAGVLTKDTVGASAAATWTKNIEVVHPYAVAYVVQVKIADRAAGGAATVALKAKYFATDAYATLTTVTWTGVGSTDSVITFNSTTNKHLYNYYQVLVTRTASTANINWVKAFVKK